MHIVPFIGTRQHTVYPFMWTHVWRAVMHDWTWTLDALAYYTHHAEVARHTNNPMGVVYQYRQMWLAELTGIFYGEERIACLCCAVRKRAQHVLVEHEKQRALAQA